MKLKQLFFLFALILLVLSSGNIGIVHSADDDILSPGDDDILSPGDNDGSGSVGGGGSGGDAGVVVDCTVPDADILFPAECGGVGGVDCTVPDAEILFPVECAIPPVVPPAEPPAEPANNPPAITAFSVPATADKNTDITLTVTATDNDGGVNRIEVMKEGVVIATESCGNIIFCTKSFIVRVPDAFSAVYTFIARVFDNLGAAVTQSGSGTTNPAPVTPPITPVVPEKALEPVKVSIPSDELFISSVVPDTGCLSPGAETFLYISLKNIGKRALNDVKITAIVPGLDIRAVSGPFSIRKGDSASRFLYFGVPEGAKPGDYYIKVSVTSGKDSVVKYRIFEVSKSC